jgi:hypothetical protein
VSEGETRGGRSWRGAILYAIFFRGLIGRSWTRRTTTLWVQPIRIARAGTHDSRIGKKIKLTSWTRIGHLNFKFDRLENKRMGLMKASPTLPRVSRGGWATWKTKQPETGEYPKTTQQYECSLNLGTT